MKVIGTLRIIIKIFLIVHATSSFIVKLNFSSQKSTIELSRIHLPISIYYIIILYLRTCTYNNIIMIYIPRGFWPGWQTLQDIHFYYVSYDNFHQATSNVILCTIKYTINIIYLYLYLREIHLFLQPKRENRETYFLYPTETERQLFILYLFIISNYKVTTRKSRVYYLYNILTIIII